MTGSTGNGGPASHPSQLAVDADHVADPHVRALLERYAGLSEAELRHVAGDCYELLVPPADRGAFGGRARVRIALSLAALDLDPDAEMAVVGSALVDQLITAVRRRGTRLAHGDLPPSISAGPGATRLETPVLNGLAGEPTTASARHPVGRLLARVTVRAGTAVQEYLAESTVFDLTTGLPLGPDVAAACTSFIASADGASPAQNSTPAGRRTRPIEELVPMMLGDLERNLAPQISKRQVDAEQALHVELARIDRYYTGMLQDIGGRGTGIPDAGARRAIEAEHARRRGEEVRRHEVRAVVHPVQLAEWTVPVERADWLLDSVDGHHGQLSGQRVLVGSGAWTLGCPHCGGLSPQGFMVCRHDHTACTACANRCGVCDTGFCTDHGIAACHVDGRPSCDEHARTCPSCHRPHCTVHETVCDDGGHVTCSACVIPCARCRRSICEEHATNTVPTAPMRQRRLCADCIRCCEGGANEPVGVDEVVRCASCERFVCSNHQATCVVDGRVHCSTHLRRTDRSRRIVCERDRATCIHEPHAIFATDELVACATCGAMACAAHTAACAVDGQRHCSVHLVPLHDLATGSLGCATHHSVCHLDKRTFSPEGTDGCPACGRRACRAHVQECANCARRVCVSDLTAGPKRICTTCAALADVSDPSDAIVQAAVAARGDEGSPKRWRQARDATHMIVELDLGWTRRIVFAVRHGANEPAAVVRHSMLGTTVVKR